MPQISGEHSRSSGPELGMEEGLSSGAGVVTALDAAAVGIFCHLTSVVMEELLLLNAQGE
jgi:hypothetical protein